MNNKSIIAIIVLLILATTTPALCDIWSNCGTANDHFQIQKVVITPDPPVKGQSLNVTATGQLNEAVTGGNAHLLIKYGFITIINQNEDICSIPNSPYQCPISAGDYQRSVIGNIPSNVPSGKYTGNVVFTDQNNQEIACISLDLTL
ncbi:hypothetical protein SAMD00019534_105650 [Acytostelium subglobosum LB1]|uniref:hypothetical protein n=1 Tax=Acytostelium subglobosum LB1 TaxID=1410327 RepID=UPI000644C0C6|nr:hypothetical protein SAMD00019534_105650 [Acytostelium subglobosum LB1]GAM27390.1 hypothetical protein SAMD00019534_105650 [Acytostelium subglobosum LB1]|eukprot:XP_012749857.1 hypothetical protein SAMD00019534_105650 [Acytostelium subglobosum LB1]